MNRKLETLSHCLLVGVLGLTACDDDPIFQEVDYEQMTAWLAEEDLPVVIIDVREPVDFNAGHIQSATNVPLSTLQDESGQLIDGGSALTSVVSNKSQAIVTYCFGWGAETVFAQEAKNMGYTEIYYYTGGTEDWDTRDNYYVIEYEAFKSWHETNMQGENPFNDGENYLIDDLPVEWYDGTDPDHPGGHIPCAWNIPIELWGNSDGEIVDDATAFTDVVTNKDAEKIVVYCGNWDCPKSLVGAAIAAELGYKNVFRYQGGQEEWIEMGEETVEGQVPCASDSDTDTDTDTQ